MFSQRIESPSLTFSTEGSKNGSPTLTCQVAANAGTCAHRVRTSTNGSRRRAFTSATVLDGLAPSPDRTGERFEARALARASNRAGRSGLLDGDAHGRRVAR